MTELARLLSVFSLPVWTCDREGKVRSDRHPCLPLHALCADPESLGDRNGIARLAYKCELGQCFYYRRMDNLLFCIPYPALGHIPDPFRQRRARVVRTETHLTDACLSLAFPALSPERTLLYHGMSDPVLFSAIKRKRALRFDRFFPALPTYLQGGRGFFPCYCDDLPALRITEDRAIRCYFFLLALQLAIYRHALPDHRAIQITRYKGDLCFELRADFQAPPPPALSDTLTGLIDEIRFRHPFFRPAMLLSERECFVRLFLPFLPESRAPKFLWSELDDDESRIRTDTLRLWADLLLAPDFEGRHRSHPPHGSKKP